MGLYTHAHTHNTHLYLRRKSKIRNWYGNVMSECVPFRICMHSMANFNCSDRSFKLSHFRTKCLHFGNFAQKFHAFDRTKFKRERKREKTSRSNFFVVNFFFATSRLFLSISLRALTFSFSLSYCVVRTNTTKRRNTLNAQKRQQKKRKKMEY